MIKVLQVGGSNSFGGIEAFQKMLFRELTKNGCLFDFIVNNKCAKLDFEDEVVANKGKIYYIPSRRQGYLLRQKLVNRILINNQYDIIHINVGSLSDDLFLKLALKHKIKKIILHSHSCSENSLGNYFLHLINKQIYINENIVRLACSKAAGEWIHSNCFTKNEFEVVNNGIDISKYIYNPDARIKIRSKLGIDENVKLIGHVARFSHEKNYDFIIKLIGETIKFDETVKFILVGDGILRNDVEVKIRKLNLSKYVVFPGLRNDIPELLSAMDIFILPSLFEGLGIVLVEAQASGLFTIVSNNIQNEVLLTKLVHKLPINNDSLQDWICKILNFNEIGDRKKYNKELMASAFCIESTIKKIENIYGINKKMIFSKIRY